MITLLMFLVSLVLVTTWIHYFNKYAYSDWTEEKVKVPNILKIALYVICFVPILNALLLPIGLLAVSMIEYEWKGWEEDKLLYWLFKK